MMLSWQGISLPGSRTRLQREEEQETCRLCSAVVFYIWVGKFPCMQTTGWRAISWHCIMWPENLLHCWHIQWWHNIGNFLPNVEVPLLRSEKIQSFFAFVAAQAYRQFENTVSNSFQLHDQWLLYNRVSTLSVCLPGSQSDPLNRCAHKPQVQPDYDEGETGTLGSCSERSSPGNKYYNPKHVGLCAKLFFQNWSFFFCCSFLL